MYACFIFFPFHALLTFLIGNDLLPYLSYKRGNIQKKKTKKLCLSPRTFFIILLTFLLQSCYNNNV